MRKRGWFKHYNDASRGESLSILAAKKDYLSIAIYWHLVEIYSSKFDFNNVDNSQWIDIDNRLLAVQYNCKNKLITRSYDAISMVAPDFKFILNDFKTRFKIDNYMKYQGSRVANKHKITSKNAAKRLVDNKIKDNKIIRLKKTREKDVENNVDNSKPSEQNKNLVIPEFEVLCNGFFKFLSLDDQREILFRYKDLDKINSTFEEIENFVMAKKLNYKSKKKYTNFVFDWFDKNF